MNDHKRINDGEGNMSHLKPILSINRANNGHHEPLYPVSFTAVNHQQQLSIRIIIKHCSRLFHHLSTTSPRMITNQPLFPTTLATTNFCLSCYIILVSNHCNILIIISHQQELLLTFRCFLVTIINHHSSPLLVVNHS